MSASEKMQFVLTANADGFVNAMRKSGDAADKELGKAQSHLDSVAGKMTKFGAGAVAAAGVAAVGLFKVGQSASDLGESVNAVNVTFGDAAKGVLKLGENAAKTVGLSKTEFNGLAVQFSSFAETIAGKGGDVVGTLDDLTQRAADFASVMNLEVNDATALFQSGLAGESEPLRKFGLDLSAAAVEAYAYANGIAETGKQLTEGEKVQARYGLLMEKTAKNAGDFANTSDGLANQQRILTAELKNMAAGIGQGVLPVMTTLISGIREGVQIFTDLPAPIQKTVGTLATLGVGALATAGSLSFIVGQSIKMRENLSTLVPALSKYGTTLGVVGAALAGGALVYKLYADDKAKAKAITLDFTEALRAEASGQKDATKLALARQITDNGALDLRKQLGLTERELADVIVGKSVPAYNKLRDTFDEVSSHGLSLEQRNKALEETYGVGAFAISGFIQNVDALSVSYGTAVANTDELTAAEWALTAATAGLSKDKRDDADASDKAAKSTRALSKDRRDDAADAKTQADKTQAVTDNLIEMDTALHLLKDNLSERDAWRNVEAALDELKTKIESGEASWAELGAATDDAVAAAANYIETTYDIPPEVKTYLYQELDKGNLDYVTGVLEDLKKGIDLPVYLKMVGKFDLKGARAGGGPVNDGTYLVGEQGPELLSIGGSGHVTPAGETARMLGGGSSGVSSAPVVNNHFNITTGADPRQVIEIIKRYKRTGGQL